MSKSKTAADIPQHLNEAVEAAKQAREENNSPATREAYKRAYNARAAWCQEHIQQSNGSRGSRAGRRQQAERRALHRGRLRQARRFF